jgi:molybdenum transport protein
MDDVAQGDLTTRILKLADKKGVVKFSLKKAGRISGIAAAQKVLQHLNLTITETAQDGTDCADNTTLISAAGGAEALHQAWKVTQNILEWSCGVAEYTALMVKAAKAENPRIQISTTRKNVPGTKLLALSAVLDGGGIIHRGGAAETILVFANHRKFLDFDNSPAAWIELVKKIKAEAPEKKIVVEADTIEEAAAIAIAAPDIIQLDKFSFADIREIVDITKGRSLISVAGGITKDNAAEYAACGIDLIVSSAPYYAKPADIKVTMSNEQ